MTLCTGLLSLGNAGFMSFGAYTSAILTVQYNLPMPLGILAGGVVAMIVGLIIGLPTTRLRGLYLAIATLGLGEVVRVIALNLDITHGALGFSGIPSMANSLSDLAGNMGITDALSMDSQTMGSLLMCIVLIILTAIIVCFWNALEHSRIGRAFKAIKADEYAASLSGIHVVYYKMMAFLFIMLMPHSSSVQPTLHGTRSLMHCFTPCLAEAMFCGDLCWGHLSLPSFRNHFVLWQNTEILFMALCW